MFEPGTPKDPTNRWVQAIFRLYKPHKINVMSHDFRTTLITDMYRESNNIVACQTYVGHKHVNTTRGYIKTTNEDV